jgi:multisubunit Na+/H+ antiporter MnhE subunit
MSQTWAVFGTDKHSVLLGSIWMGVAVSLLFGVPILLILNNYQTEIPIWVGIIFILIVFPVATYSLYKAGCKKIKQ